MHINLIKLALPALCIFISSVAWSQSGLTSSGGVALGANGVVTYSMGLVSYTSASNDELSISQGVQHAFQFSPVSSRSILTTDFDISVYPNPTSERINIVTKNPSLTALVLRVYSDSGQMLMNRKLETENIEITLSTLANGIYIFEISNNQTPLQSFKIIKNS